MELLWVLVLTGGRQRLVVLRWSLQAIEVHGSVGFFGGLLRGFEGNGRMKMEGKQLSVERESSVDAASVLLDAWPWGSVVSWSIFGGGSN